jgi:hypothetical protein
MAQKIVISKPGYNVLTETNPDNQIYNSDYGTLVYYTSGSVDLTVTGSDAETYVTHSLGYIPFFICYLNYVPNDTDYATVPFFFADAGVYFLANSYATSTRIYFTIKTNVVELTTNFKYKIFRNNTGL